MIHYRYIKAGAKTVIAYASEDLAKKALPRIRRAAPGARLLGPDEHVGLAAVPRDHLILPPSRH